MQNNPKGLCALEKLDGGRNNKIAKENEGKN